MRRRIELRLFQGAAADVRAHFESGHFQPDPALLIATLVALLSTARADGRRGAEGKDASLAAVNQCHKLRLEIIKLIADIAEASHGGASPQFVSQTINMLLSDQQATEMRKLATSRAAGKPTYQQHKEDAFPRGWYAPVELRYDCPMAKLPQTAKREVAADAKRAGSMKMPTSAGYELDFQAWLNRQAQALRSRDSEVLDWEHLAEEIEAMAASQKREITTHLKILLIHLLKWKWQSDKRSFSWKNSIENARDELSDLFEQSPSLKSKVGEVLPKAYKRAMREAANEMGYDGHHRMIVLPQECPWTFEQLMDEGFWPEPAKR